MTETAPAPDETMLVGIITAAFGLRGQVKMRAITNNPDGLRRVSTLYLGPKRAPYPLRAVHQPKPGTLILTLGGIEGRSAAEELRASEVFIHERDAAPLDADEYYLHQLYGLLVVDEAGAEIGKVREVLETGANEVLVVTRPGQADALIPMIRDVVRTLDIPGGRIVISPIEGLL
jgi:16S rRNA processing protein RimM